MKTNQSYEPFPGNTDIRQYLDGSMPEEKVAELMQAADHDPLIAEALEGYAIHPEAVDAVPAFGDVSHFIAAHHGSHIAATAARTGLWGLNSWVIGAVAASATGGAVYVATVQHERSEEAKVKAAQVMSSSKRSNTEEITIPYEEAAAALNSSVPPITEESSIPSTESETSDSAAAFEQHSSLSVAGTQSTTSSETNEVSRILSMNGQNKVASGTATPASLETPNSRSGARVAIGITFVNGFKVADYTAIRKTNWADPGGVPASKENANSEDLSSGTTPVAYMDYVRECMILFSSKNYTGCIDAMKPIMQQYPDDINAVFYTGMSLYYTGQYDAAIKMLAKASKNQIRTFREEANFYQAKSLKSIGRLDEAQLIFQEIVLQDGFYAEKAKKELN